MRNHHHELPTLSPDELTTATGGWQMPAPSTLMNLGVNAAKLADKPGKTLDNIRGLLGIPDSGAPGSTYTPAQLNPDGGITPGQFTEPREPGVPFPPTSF